jgi:hypothetical protein
MICMALTLLVGTKMKHKQFIFYHLFLMLLMTAFFMSGCQPRKLPNTNVSPTRENKKIIKFLEQYKAALEKRNVEAVMEMVAKDYNDNMGSEDPKLQVDYLGLKEKLEKTMPRIQDLRLGIFVQHITKLDKDKYEIVFYFNRHALVDVPSGEKWASTKEVCRMIIRKRYNKESPYEFEILQGL